MSGWVGGLLLVLAFGLLAMPGFGIGLGLVAAQGLVLAGAAVVRRLYPEAAALLLLNAMALPWVLRALPLAPPRRPRIGPVLALCSGAVLAVLAAPVSVPLAVLLLGILVAATSRDRRIQVLGLLAMQSGIALAGLGQAQPERIAAILPVIPALAWAALWAAERRAS